MFEVFFRYEPCEPKPDGSFSAIREVWRFPLDISAVEKSLHDVREFCFPDLERLLLMESPESSHSESYCFSVGKDFHGICLRALPESDTGQRYDVSRRPKHCYVIVTKFPYFEYFQAVLHQVRGMTFLSKHHQKTGNKKSSGGRQNGIPNIVRDFLSDLLTVKSMNSNHVPDYVCRGLANGSDKFHRDASLSVLNLVDVLGLDQFMLLLSALLLERRIVVVAGEVDTLSRAVMACVEMIFPFRWQHVYIPLLPASKLGYLNAPMPFVIGVKRYIFDSMDSTFMDGVVIVDIDEGCLQTLGDVEVMELVGNSGSALRQASEGIAQLTNKMSKGFASIVSNDQGGAFEGDVEGAGAGGSRTQQTEGPVRKDIIAAMFVQLKPFLAAKPSACDNDVTTNLSTNDIKHSQSSRHGQGLRRLSMAGKAIMTKISGKSGNTSSGQSGSTELGDGESRSRGRGDGNSNRDVMTWKSEGEKLVRDNLLLFFLYLFADLDQFYRHKAYRTLFHGPATYSSNTSYSNDDAWIEALDHPGTFAENDSRSSFDLAAFFRKKHSPVVGLSKELLHFLKEFLHSQLFEQYCAERKYALDSISMRRSASSVNVGNNAANKKPSGIYEQAVVHMMNSSGGSSAVGINVTISGIKKALNDLSHTQETAAHLGYSFVGEHPVVSRFLKQTRQQERYEYYDALLGSNVVNMVDTTLLQGVSSVNRDLGINMDWGGTSVLASTVGTKSNTLLPPADLICDMCVLTEQQYLHSSHDEHCMLYEISRDACSSPGSDCGLMTIIKSIQHRLIDCLYAEAKGDDGRIGAQSLIILQHLLLYGPESSLSLILDLLPLIRGFVGIKASPHSCIDSLYAFDYDDGELIPKMVNIHGSTHNHIRDGAPMLSGREMESHNCGGATDRVKIEASAVIILLLDHSILATRRRHVASKTQVLSENYESPSFAKNVSGVTTFSSLGNGYGNFNEAPEQSQDPCTDDEEGYHLKDFAAIHQEVRPAGMAVSKPRSLILKDQYEVEEDDEEEVFEGASYTILAEAAMGEVNSSDDIFQSAPSSSHHGESFSSGSIKSTLSSMPFFPSQNQQPSSVQPVVDHTSNFKPPSVLDTRSVEEKMIALYSMHQPAKVGDVSILLKKYMGREQEMLSKLEARYGQAPLQNTIEEEEKRPRSLSERSAAAVAAASAARSSFSSLVTDVSSASLALVANVGANVGAPGIKENQFGDMMRRRSSGNSGGKERQNQHAADTVCASSSNTPSQANNFGTAAAPSANEPTKDQSLQQHSNTNEIKQRMISLYEAYLPSKVHDVPQLLEKYKGREIEMLRKLEERFGAVSHTSMPHTESNLGKLESTNPFVDLLDFKPTVPDGGVAFGTDHRHTSSSQPTMGDTQRQQGPTLISKLVDLSSLGSEKGDSTRRDTTSSSTPSTYARNNNSGDPFAGLDILSRGK
jgi:hypothetical protein